MKKSTLKNLKQILNFKLALILYTILILSTSKAAPTTNSPSKLLPSTKSQQEHNIYYTELLLDDQTTQQNGDTYDQFEISTTTLIPSDNLKKLKQLAFNEPESIPLTTTNTITAPPTAATLFATTKTIQKLRKFKSRLGKKAKEKFLKATQSNHNSKETKPNDDISKLFEKSTTTTATTTAMTTEVFEVKTTSNSILATTSPEPIVIDYLTTTESSPLNELLNLNDQKVEEALLLAPKDVKNTDKPITESVPTTQNVNNTPNLVNASIKLAALENTKQIIESDIKKSKHFESKKSHLNYKKKSRQKNRNFNPSKMIQNKSKLATSTSTSISVPISSTTNEISNPIILPTTIYTSASTSTSSSDPFNKLNTKTVNPFRHQDAIDDISAGDTVSATTLGTTTIETPLAMASATSTHQTTSADNIHLKAKQSIISSSSPMEKIDDSIQKYASLSDDLITTYSTQLQSVSSTHSSTLQPLIINKLESKKLTTANIPSFISESELSKKNPITTPNEFLTTLNTLFLKEATTNQSPELLITEMLPTTSNNLSTNEKDSILSTTAQPFQIKKQTTSNLFETSSSPTTFMAQNQLKYTDDDGSNVELVTTKFITDKQQILLKNKEKEVDQHTTTNLDKTTYTPNISVTKSTTATTVAIKESPPIMFEYKTRFQSVNDYKSTNSKKTINKDNKDGVNDNNENTNFNTIIQIKEMIPHKIIPTESSLVGVASAGTKEKNILNRNEYTISTKHPMITTSTTAALKAQTFYTSLKDTFRAIHTTSRPIMGQDISILGSRLNNIAQNATMATITETSINDNKENKLQYIAKTEITTEINDMANLQHRENSTTEPTLISTEKLIKLTDIENIDSTELTKSNLIETINNHTENLKKQEVKSSVDKTDNTTQSSVGHDGLKATKKKQLLEKHFKSATDRLDTEVTSIPEHKLGPLRMKETIVRPKIEHRPTESSIETASTSNEDKISKTTEQYSKILQSFKSSTESDNDSTVMLDIDLISENSSLNDDLFNLQSMPTVRTKTTTESDFVKHKNFEKSLIPKLEWVPIASVEHFDFEDFSRSSMTPPTTKNLYSYDVKKTENDHLIQPNESQTKSLEVELIEPTQPDKYLSETVPEFFEITKPISSNQNLKDNEKENSETSPIEIQINVSEGFGNENENLEFSFRQMHSDNAFKPVKVAHTMQNPPPGFQEIGEITIQRSAENQTLESAAPKAIMSISRNNFPKNDSHRTTETEEILQVEITAIDNSTGIESFNEPKFTLHSESNRNRENDDIFIPDLKVDSVDEMKEQTHQLDNFNRDNLDRDSDTIFYISNTEVKVAESKPTATTLHRSDYETLTEILNHRNKTAAEINRSKLESQFFPTIYEEDVRIDVSKNKNTTEKEKQPELERYEEDIILSNLKGNFDPLKVEPPSQRQNNDNMEMSNSVPNSDNTYPLNPSAADVSYVGETLIEIEESTNANPAIPPFDFITYTPPFLSRSNDAISKTKKDSNIPMGMIIAGESEPVEDLNGENTSGALLSDVIIQPAVIPEMSIGVPVIGELPPQIELKEIDYIPNSANNGINQNQQQQIQSEQIDGGAIQYGGDLISDDEASGNAGSRYIFESSYPFGDERIRKVGRLRNEQNFDNDASDLDDNESNSSSHDDDGFNTQNGHNSNKASSNTANNNVDLTNDDSMLSQQQIVMHAINSNFQKEQFIADFPSYDTLKEIPQKRNNNKEDKSPSMALFYNSTNNSQAILNSVTTQATLNNIFNTTTIGQTFGNGSTFNSTEPEQLGNATAFIIMDDAEGNIFDLTDVQTLLIACFATLIPLVLSLLLAFAVRYLWKKYRRDEDPDEEGGLVGDASIDPMANKSGAMSQDELRTTESGYTLNRSNDTLDTNATDLDGVANGNGNNENSFLINSNCTNNNNINNNINNNNNNNNSASLNGGKIMTNHCTGAGNNGNINNNNCGVNGSVITMTMKNNHLIVETEERNDISRDARETTMHYNSSDKDGVFVVEVARGADSTGVPNSPYKENHIGQKACSVDMDTSNLINCKTTPKNASNHEEVQIHQPPNHFDNDTLAIAKSATISELDEANFELEERGINLGNMKTGLSQSDLSSSSNDSNKGYNYGKQELYTTEMKVYDPTSPKPKLSSDSMDSVKDKSENGFGDNCDTETSPQSRDNSSSLGKDKKKTDKSSENFKQNNTTDQNHKNYTAPNSNAAANIVCADANKTPIKSELKPKDVEMKITEKEPEKIPEIKENKSESIIKKIDEDKNEKIDLVEKEIENNTTDTIENNDTLPPPPPQFKEETSTNVTNELNGHPEEEEEEKGKEENKNENNDVKDEIENNPTVLTVSDIETKPTLVATVTKSETLEEKPNITYHENGLDDHNHNDNSNNLMNGHEKQNGIIHNNDNDDDDDDDDDDSADNDDINDPTIDTNDDKKLNGLNEDKDRIILSPIVGCNENGFDSILSLPDPPSTEEIKQMNDIILMENSQLDSLPPPPPIDLTTTAITPATTTKTIITINGENGEYIDNSNSELLIKNNMINGNCEIITNNSTDIKSLLNGDHHHNTTILTTEEEQQQTKQHQNGITNTNNGTSTLVAVNGSS